MAEAALKTQIQGDAKASFVGKCPQCGQQGRFTPETLYRWCVSETPGDYSSEPAKHLTRIESLDRNSYDPDLDKLAHVLFAATCPNPKCQKPIFLRVEGRKIEFVKIVRQRQGRPHGQTEEDLRLLDLKLVETLPELANDAPGFNWKCSLELGDLCPALNRLAPEMIEKRDAVDVASTCRSLLDELLFKLEARREIVVQINWLADRDRQGFWGFLMDIGRAFNNRPISKAVRRAYVDAKTRDKKSFNPQMLIDHLSYGYFDLAVVRKTVEADLKRDRQNRRANDRPSVTARLWSLYDKGVVDRTIWRWAVRMEQEAKASGEDFYNFKRKEELAAFVRILADDALEQPDEVLLAYNERKERPTKNGGRVPTK